MMFLKAPETFSISGSIGHSYVGLGWRQDRYSPMLPFLRNGAVPNILTRTFGILLPIYQSKNYEVLSIQLLKFPGLRHPSIRMERQCMM